MKCGLRVMLCMTITEAKLIKKSVYYNQNSSLQTF